MEPRTKDTIQRLLHPRSIALVGASSREGKAGFGILKNLQRWKGDLFCVNPKETEILGLRVYPSVEALPDGIDLAVLALGAKDSVEAARQCARKGFKAVIPIAGGFSETGEEGRRLEDELRREVVSRGTRVLGPNSLGVFVPGTGLDTIFVEHGDLMFSEPGEVAFITQSGSIGTEALGYAGVTGWGLRAWVGLGNKLDIAEHEFIEYFAGDEGTCCIAFYLETFTDGRTFIEECRKVALRKPVVVLKAGRTGTAARAVASHTGRMAGESRVFLGAARQAGIHVAENEEDLVDYTRILSHEPPAMSPAVAVLSSAGGFGIITMDQIEQSEFLSPAVLSGETVERLAKGVLPFASMHNPVDLTGSATDEMMAHALACLEDDPAVGVILVLEFLAPPGLTRREIEILAEHRGRTRKPLVVFSIFGPSTDEVAREMYRRGVMAFTSVRRSVRAAMVLAEQGYFLGRGGKKKRARRAAVKKSGWPAKAKRAGGLDELEMKKLLGEKGIDVPAGVRLRAGMDPRKVKLPFNGLCVVKVLDRELAHKSEAGGVAGFVRAADLPAAVAGMRKRFPGKDLLVEKMITEPGIEVIAGCHADEDFGPVVMLGLGGLFAEAYLDVTFRMAPLDEADVEDMIATLKGRKLFENFRGMSVDRRALAGILVTLGNMAIEFKSVLGQIDLNPVLLTPAGAIVLDAKLLSRLEPRSRNHNLKERKT